MHALLNINKPRGITSRDAVNRVQRLVRPHKIGHAGTLDPLASGVLVVAIGSATRLIEFVQQQPKRYLGTFLLGQSSTTEDVEGEITQLPDAPQPSHEALVQAAAKLTGEILQRPPAYSALKVNGRRAYKLARRGEMPNLAPRPITIHQLNVVRYEYPVVELDIGCSSGTYVRSLGRDLAESLGTAAVMSALIRTAIGQFKLEDACELDQLNADTLSQYLLPTQAAVAHLPRYELTETDVINLRHGRSIATSKPATTELLAGFDPQGNVVGMISVAQPGVATPERILAYDKS